MWYFAYGADMSPDSLAEWSRRAGIVAPNRGTPRPAVLRNYRMCFPTYDQLWNGGIANVVPEPGKHVAGALFQIHRISLKQLDRLYMSGEGGRRPRLWTRVSVPVVPYNSAQPVLAYVYRLLRPEWRHVPPSPDYMSRLIDSAGTLGLSSLWVMHLQSFGVSGNSLSISPVRPLAPTWEVRQSSNPLGLLPNAPSPMAAAS